MIKNFWLKWSTSANLFLLSLVLITILNSLFEYNIYSYDTSSSTQQESRTEVLVTSRKFEDFGLNKYTASTEKGFYQFNNSKYLEVGQKYYISGTRNDYNYSQRFDQYKHQLLSQNIKGEYKNVSILQTNYAQDYQYQVLNRVDKTRTYISNKFYEFYCIDNLDISKIFQIKCQDIYGLSYGLILGGTDKFSQEAKESFKDLGLYHLVAVSGFQIVLIVSFLEYFLNKLRFRNLTTWQLTISLLVLFIILAGPQPPIIRSFLSIGISLSVLTFLGRRISTIRALTYSGIIMLWFNPLYLFSVSFLLSFVATVGIIIAGFTYSETDFKLWKNIKVLFRSTLYAFLFTLPIIILIAKKVTMLAVLTNILIVPLIPLITIFNIIGLIPLFGEPFLFVSGLLQGIIIQIAQDLQGSRISNILSLEMETFQFWGYFLYYLILLIVTINLPKWIQKLYSS